MVWQDIALIVAGAIGSVVAVIHAVLVRRLMTKPFANVLRHDESFAPSIERLVPMLLDYSGFSWFISGCVLIASVLWLGAEARLVAAILAGSAFLYAAIGNFRSTNGRHPGWVLYALAVILTLAGSHR